ncbi:hypothetical protein CFP56_006718 [Quercus suber]|uniref:Uncharacterized protein n=1 Tax=Quercus suber TaxID=58331 RepID=A0AAW0LA92_QUESU
METCLLEMQTLLHLTGPAEEILRIVYGSGDEKKPNNMDIVFAWLGDCSMRGDLKSCDAELPIDGFEYLKENFPIGLTEFLEYMARVGEQSVILCRCGYEA